MSNKDRCSAEALRSANAGVASAHIMRRPLSRFILKEDQDIFYLKRKQVLESGEQQEFELRMVKSDGTRFWAHLAATVARGVDGATELGIVLSDISGRKRAEEALRDRIKKLKCLYAISKLVDEERSLEQVLRDSADLVPSGAYYPEIACACIIFQGRQYLTRGHCREPASRQSAELRMGDQSVGTVNLCCLGQRLVVDAGPFLTEEKDLIEAVAGMLGRFAQRQELELRLREVTSTLEEKVKIRTNRLRALTRQLTMTEERERRLLAEELHDNLVQIQASIKIQLTILDAGPLRPQVDRIMALVDQANQSARMIVHQLSPPILHSLGLLPALEHLAIDMKRTYGLAVQVIKKSSAIPADDDKWAVLYRSIRELLINVAKHAKVDEASLCYMSNRSGVMLVVSDAGRGFVASGRPDALLEQHGFGLGSIYERIVSIGGEMLIHTSPGKGTTVTLSVPCTFVAAADQVS